MTNPKERQKSSYKRGCYNEVNHKIFIRRRKNWGWTHMKHYFLGKFGQKTDDRANRLDKDSNSSLKVKCQK